MSGASNLPPPTDPWAPGVRAIDVPITPGGDPSSFADEFETVAAMLHPNRNDISRHLFELFPPAFAKDYLDAWIEIAYAGLGGDGVPNAARHFSAFELDKAADFAEAKNRAGFNIYVGPALRHGKTGDNSNGRSSGANFLASHYQWVDFEKPGDDTRINASLKEKNLLTTMTVVTGNTPNFRAHLYFKISGKATKDQVRDVNTALKKWLGTDDVQDPCRVMRLAGTVSYPPPGKVERGYVPELVTLHVRKNAPSYSPEQLLGLAGKPSSGTFGFDPNNAAKPGRTDDELIAKLEASRVDGQWHNSMRAAIATMIGRGDWSDLQIRLACATYCRGGADDPDLDDLIDRGRKKWNKPDPENAAHDYSDEFAAKPKDQDPQQAQPFELFWHGTKYDRALRSWLIEELIPETGQGLASGQWGMAKTFTVLDLAAEIMIGGIFAGRTVARKGGVIFVAAEGANEMPIRLEGLVEQKLRPEYRKRGLSEQSVAGSLDVLPFAWIEDCPNLQNDGDFNRLMVTIKQAAERIREQFNLPLVLIIIDTLNAVANFKDGNDAAEGQKVMNRIGEISRQTGAFALAVDHFGKMVETGTRGTSAKEAAADVVLALLGERDTAGNISNTRMAVRKLRGGKVGTETAFDLNVVHAGFGQTTCVVEWKEDRTAAPAATAGKDRWPRSLRIFKAALETAVIDHGKPMRPYGKEGALVKAAPYFDVRDEFLMAYPADGDDANARMHAKQMAFTRALKLAREKELVGSRDLGGVDFLWLIGPDENKPHTTEHKRHTP